MSKWYRFKAWLTQYWYKDCPTCKRSGPPRDKGQLDWHTGPDESECTACAVARHYGWLPA